MFYKVDDTWKMDGVADELGFRSVWPQKDNEAIRRTRFLEASIHSG